MKALSIELLSKKYNLTKEIIEIIGKTKLFFQDRKIS